MEGLIGDLTFGSTYLCKKVDMCRRIDVVRTGSCKYPVPRSYLPYAGSTACTAASGMSRLKGEGCAPLLYATYQE